MSLHFENISILDKHTKFLDKKIKSENIFLVGGCIRDLLLGIEEDPKDIDITMQGNPIQIYKKIDKKNLSHFMTEKFGTITLLQKSEKKPEKKSKKTLSDLSDSLSDLSDSLSDVSVKYELTPLRTEGGYEDFRHPGEINRSDDIILDSNRRDFTINCMYYFSTAKAKIIKKIDNPKFSDEELLIKTLERDGFVFITNTNTFIIQKKHHISKLFKEGKIQYNYFIKFQNELKDNIIELKDTKFKNSLNTKQSKLSTNKSVRFLLDPHKGINDLLLKKIRSVGNADNRFSEDALRIVRGLRFANILNVKLKKFYNNTNNTSKNFFDFEKITWNSIKKNHKLVTKVAKERLKEELTQVFQSDNPFGFVALLDEIDLIKFFFPALYETKFITQPVRYHPFDIYTHILLSLFEIQKFNTNYLVKLGILYHDVGKVEQFKSYKKNLSPQQIREILSGPLNHRKSGPELVKKDFNKLGFSRKEIDEIARYVANHHKPEEVLYANPENKIKKARKFLSECGYERAINILDICIADRMGQYNPLQTGQDTGEVYELKGILETMHKSEGQFTAKKLAINGKDIIKHFKLKPGPIIGELLTKALDRAMNNINKRNHKDKILKYLEIYIKQKK